MKKTLLAAFFAATMASGCSMVGGADTVSYEELKTTGADLVIRSMPATKDNKDGYQMSLVQELEIARVTVNTVFLAAQPAYEEYTKQIQATATLGNFFSAVEAAESEEDKQAIFDALSPEQKAEVKDLMDSSVMSEMMEGLKKSKEPILNAIIVFQAIDTKSLISGLEFQIMLAEKDKIELTIEQIAYLNSTVVSAYNNYQIVSAFTNAQ